MTRAEAQRRVQAIASDVVTRTTLAWIADQRAAGRPLEDAHAEITRSAAEVGAAIKEATGQIAELLLAGAAAPLPEAPRSLDQLAADVAEMRLDGLAADYSPGLQPAQIGALLGRDVLAVEESILIDLVFSLYSDAVINRRMHAVALRLEMAAERHRRRLLASRARGPRTPRRAVVSQFEIGQP